MKYIFKIKIDNEIQVEEEVEINTLRYENEKQYHFIIENTKYILTLIEDKIYFDKIEPSSFISLVIDEKQYIDYNINNNSFKLELEGVKYKITNDIFISYILEKQQIEISLKRK